MDRKTKATSSRKSRCKGGTGHFDGLGGQRLIRQIMLTATPRNLTGMLPIVNHLRVLEDPDGLRLRLPGLGTFGARRAGSKTWMGATDR
jgi:hypothetical protein